MKVLSKEEKLRVEESKRQSRRSKVLEDIHRVEHRARTVERVVLYLFLAVLLAAISALVWLLLDARQKKKDRYRQETYGSYVQLISEAEGIEKQLGESIAKLDIDLVRNHSLIEKTQDVAFLYDELNKARSLLDMSRSELQLLFGGIYARFPPESINERKDAQRLYGEIMGRFDAEEERFEDLESALTLLVDNRTKWKAKHGQVVFSDPELKKEFNYYSQANDPSTTRWRKDFGSSIESNVIEVPTHAK